MAHVVLRLFCMCFVVRPVSLLLIRNGDLLHLCLLCFLTWRWWIWLRPCFRCITDGGGGGGGGGGELRDLCVSSSRGERLKKRLYVRYGDVLSSLRVRRRCKNSEFFYILYHLCHCSRLVFNWRNFNLLNPIRKYLHMLVVLCLQELFALRFNAEGQIGAWDDVSPVSPHSHLVSSLTHTYTHRSVNSWRGLGLESPNEKLIFTKSITDAFYSMRRSCSLLVCCRMSWTSLRFDPTQHGCLHCDETYATEHARGQQTLISDAVKPLPHLEGHAAPPPPAVLLLVYDATLSRRKKTENKTELWAGNATDQSEVRTLEHFSEP